LKTTSFCTFN